MERFKCECGNTEREGQHPFDCETCPDCGSKILAPYEEFDTPLDHVPIEHEGKTICKRCRKDL